MGAVARAVLAELADDPEAVAELRTLLSSVTGVTPGELLTAAEVAERLKVDKRTVNRWAAEGRVPAVAAGNAWRFRLEDVVAKPKRQVSTGGQVTCPTRDSRRSPRRRPSGSSVADAIRGG